MNIRDATEADIPAMVEMGRKFYDQTGYESFIPFDPESFSWSLQAAIREQVALVTEGGMAVAMIAPSYVNHAFNVAFELFFWMEPEKRGGGMALLEALEDRVRSLGAETMAVVACDGLKPEALSRAYERRGYVRTETTFVRTL